MREALLAAVDAVISAVHEGRAEALPDNASRLLRHARHSGAHLVRAGDLHQTADAAAVQVAWERDEALRDATWLCFRYDGDWVFAGPTPTDSVAQWFLAHPTDTVPEFTDLPSTSEVSAEADRLLGMIRGDVPRPSEGVEADLTAPVESEGLTPTVGQVRVLDAADRAMVELAWVEDADPEWTEESRWAVLDRSEGSWRVEQMVYLGTMRSLLEGAGLAWPPTV